MAKTQSFDNHTRWFPLQHFIIVPLLILLLIYRLIRFYQLPDVENAVWIGVVILLAFVSLSARLQALKVQDRLIRLEEKLRYRELLAPELCTRADALTLEQIIALRFAGDDELANLAERTIAGELKTPTEIKMAVKSWRADYLRA